MNADLLDGLARYIPFDEESTGYGAALYIGAKNMICRLYDLQTGKLLAHTSASGDYLSFSGSELKQLMTDVFETLATSAKITLAKIKVAAVSASTALESKVSGKPAEELVYAGGGDCEDFGCDIEYILPGSTSIAVGEAYLVPCLGPELGGDFLCGLLALDALSAESPTLVVYSDPTALENDLSIALTLGCNDELHACGIPSGMSVEQAITRFLEACEADQGAIGSVFVVGDDGIELPDPLRDRAKSIKGAAIEGVSAILISEDAEDELCRIVSSCKVVSL